MDYSCDECYRLRQPHTETCPRCGMQTFVGQVINSSSVWSCTNCGESVASAGGFPPACLTDTRYLLTISKPDDPKAMVGLARILGMNSVDLNKAFDESEGRIEKDYKALECIRKQKRIIELGVKCSTEPSLLLDFHRIKDCKYPDKYATV